MAPASADLRQSERPQVWPIRRLHWEGGGIGNLKEVCEGASPRSLAGPRDDSYTKVTPRRICDKVNGPARPPGFRLGGRDDGIAKVSLGGEGTGPRPRSTLRSASAGFQLGGSSTGGCSIFDWVSGPKSGLYEDFIKREKGLGTLRRDVKGQVLDPSRSLGMTVIQRSRLGGSATG